MNIDLTTIINAIIGLLAALVTYRLIPWIKAKTTNEQQAYIRALVKAGVYAAEQIYNTDGMGTKKMEYVKNFLLGYGFDINVTEIEAAVKEYINPPVLPTLPVATIPIEAVEKPDE
jgi:2-keto-3-deoxy-6-phosphogluconate aldolase